MSVDTKRLQTRRTVHYNTFDDFCADVEKMASMDTRTVGNWSEGQIYDHLARSLGMALNGSNVSYPAPLRFVLGLVKRRILTNPMKPGFRLPKRFHAELLPSPEFTTAAGLERLREAMRLFRDRKTLERHAFFGRLTREEWVQLTLRHAELHMSFIVPR